MLIEEPKTREPLPRETVGLAWESERPYAVLLVDRAPLVALFAESKASSGLAVVSLGDSSSPAASWLQERFGAGWSAPILYVHDAATILYPFSIEPIATLVAHRTDEPIVYQDLGLPPLGATARRFHDPTLRADALVTTLDALPPATLIRFCVDAARRLVAPKLHPTELTGRDARRRER